MTEQIILASGSPRRRELLNQIGVTYRVHAVDIDETALPDEPPDVYGQRIAAEKSACCVKQFKSTLPVLAADTSVVLNGAIMGKPKDAADAEAMLMALSGRTHQVYTAVSLRNRCQHYEVLSVTDVCFKPLTKAEVRAYWHSGEPVDKAGAYAIQGLGSVFIQSLSGSYSGVMGLPLFETAALLQQQGIKIIQ